VWIVHNVSEHLHWNGRNHKCCEYTPPVEKIGRSPPLGDTNGQVNKGSPTWTKTHGKVGVILAHPLLRFLIG
jgi:hypothetical protein